jgi:hypothetical protein
MIPRRFGLAQSMGTVAYLAVALAMMKAAPSWLARLLVATTMVALLVATLGALVARRGRGAWTGAAVFGWGFATIVVAGPYLADNYSVADALDVWEVDLPVRALADLLHPGAATAPVDPFPNNNIIRDPATGSLLKQVNNSNVAMTAEEIRLQLAFEAQTKVYEAQVHKARHARAIGLTALGLGFALLGARVGNWLEAREAEPAGGNTP